MHEGKLVFLHVAAPTPYVAVAGHCENGSWLFSNIPFIFREEKQTALHHFSFSLLSVL
jgi:hypothetical protein